MPNVQIVTIRFSDHQLSRLALAERAGRQTAKIPADDALAPYPQVGAEAGILDEHVDRLTGELDAALQGLDFVGLALQRQVLLVEQGEQGVEDQVLWTAENEADFCDRKAREFVAKQESWGWTCVETIQEKSTDNSAMEAPAEDAEEAPAE